MPNIITHGRVIGAYAQSASATVSVNASTTLLLALVTRSNNALINSITFAGSAMTYGSGWNTADLRNNATIYYYLFPPSGNQTIAVSFNKYTDICVYVIQLGDANVICGTGAGSSYTSTHIYTNITSSLGNAILINVATCFYTFVSSNYTLLASADYGYARARINYTTLSSPGSVTFDCETSQADGYGGSSAAIAVSSVYGSDQVIFIGL